MESVLSISETMDWAQDPTHECAGMPVIYNTSFESLAADLANFEEVQKTPEEIYDFMLEQTKRFSGCGANFGGDENYALIRKNPVTGWQYILDYVLE